MDYREAGVDLAAASVAQARIAALARGTFSAAVLTDVGSFGGMFRPNLSNYEDPLLVASTDGVGTKIHVARAVGVHDSVGYDLVSHCINDILVQGALPLFFLDYIAVGRLDPARVEALVAGFARACREFSCPLIGGETAEMPGTYAADDYDLAGFIVGLVERRRALTGERVREGDSLLGLPSTGLHTNGYSLARKVLFDRLDHDVDTRLPELDGASLGEALLAPHRCYLPVLEPLLAEEQVSALAHITGGGLPGNLPRVLPAGLGARVRRSAWRVPALFRAIEHGGAIGEEEMDRTFNMGIGMVLVVAPECQQAVQRYFENRGEPVVLMGSVVAGSGVTFD